MRLPTDRVIVDPQHKLMDHWHGVFKTLEPLLDLSVDDFVALKALISATQEGEANVFDLPVDSSPDFTRDYATEVKYNGTAMKLPLSRFRSSLISATDLNGQSSVGVQIPATYPHVRFVILGMSFSTTAEGSFSLSEDGGANFLASAFNLFGGGGHVYVATTADTTPNLTASGGSGATAFFSIVLDIHNVAGTSNKLARMDAVLDSSGTTFTGSYIFTSIAPVNYAQFNVSAGSFDAGTVELWGIP